LVVSRLNDPTAKPRTTFMKPIAWASDEPWNPKVLKPAVQNRVPSCFKLGC